MQIFDNCLEQPLPDCYPNSTVFNDLALHTFPPEMTAALPGEAWTDAPEPKPDPLDLEIIPPSVRP